MNIEQMLQQTDAVGAISRELGIDPATAQAGATRAAALDPLWISATGGSGRGGRRHRGRAKQRLPGDGRAWRLLGTIGGLGGGALLDNAVSSEPTEIGKGNEILGQIFGSKDGSRAVAAQASAQSGVEPSLLKKMLPVLAMVAAGYITKQAGKGKGGGGGLSDAIGGMLGGAGQQPGSQGQPDILGSLIGAAGKYLGR